MRLRLKRADDWVRLGTPVAAANHSYFNSCINNYMIIFYMIYCAVLGDAATGEGPARHTGGAAPLAGVAHGGPLHQGEQ